MAGPEQTRRDELAAERGYESYYYERQAREFAYDRGASRENVEEMAQFFDNYVEGDLTVDEWRDIYAELYGDDYDDADFYEWLQEYYSES